MYLKAVPPPRFRGEALRAPRSAQVEKATNAYAAMKNRGQQYGEQKEQRAPTDASIGGDAADDCCCSTSEPRSTSSEEETGGGPGGLTVGAEGYGRIAGALKCEAPGAATGRYERLGNLGHTAAPYSLEDGYLYNVDGDARTRLFCAATRERAGAL